MESREGRSVLEGRLEVALKEAEQVNITSFPIFFNIFSWYHDISIDTEFP